MSTIGDLAVVGTNGLTAATSSITISTSAINNTKSADSVLDKYIMNQYTIDHKISDVEMLKLKEVQPDFAETIKENIAKNLARDISKKVTFTKRVELDTNTNHFIGRVWCFTTDELKQLIKDSQNV